MKIIKVVVIVFILLLDIKLTFCQEELDSLYGLNPILYNGQKYTYYIPGSVSGNQYLKDKDFRVGGIDIRNRHFENVLLNYDIFNQEVVFSFKLKKQFLKIKVFKDRINKFSIEGNNFELIQDDELNYVIYEVIGEGDYKILIHWQKWMKVSSNAGSGTYTFTKPLKKMYMKSNNQIKKFKSNRTFISLIEDTKKQHVKEYLKQHKIKVAEASNKELYKLMKLYNSL